MSLLLALLGGGINASLTVTEADDTLTANASVLVTGTLSATEANDTLTAVTTVLVTATLSVTEADDTLAATATVPIGASLAALEADNALATASVVFVVGGLALTSADSTLLSDGSVNAVIADLAITEDDDALVSDASVTGDVSTEVGGPIVGGTFSRGRWRDLKAQRRPTTIAEDEKAAKKKVKALKRAQKRAEPRPRPEPLPPDRTAGAKSAQALADRLGTPKPPKKVGPPKPATIRMVAECARSMLTGNDAHFTIGCRAETAKFKLRGLNAFLDLVVEWPDVPPLLDSTPIFSAQEPSRRSRCPKGRRSCNRDNCIACRREFGRRRLSTLEDS